MRSRPTCRKCGATHFNFQPCVAALGKTERSAPPLELRPREGWHDFHDLDKKGAAGYGAGIQWRDDGPKAA